MLLDSPRARKPKFFVTVVFIFPVEILRLTSSFVETTVAIPSVHLLRASRKILVIMSTPTRAQILNLYRNYLATAQSFVSRAPFPLAAHDIVADTRLCSVK